MSAAGPRNKTSIRYLALAITLLGLPMAHADDYSTVCAASGVVRCVGFESPVAQAVYADPGQDANNDGNGTYSYGYVDNTVAASGTSSFHFVVPAFAQQDSSGEVHFNFDPTLNTSFGQGQEFYVQFRIKMDSNYLSNAYLIGNSCPTPDGTPRLTTADCPGDTLYGGMKQIIIGPQDTSTVGTQYGKHWSCEVPHIVITMGYNQAPVMYHSCGYYEPFNPAYVPPGASFPSYLNQSAIACGGVLPLTSPAPDPCVKYVANQWMTIQIHVKVGHWYLVSPTTLKGDYNMRRDSQVDMWLAQENQPSVLVESMVFYDIRNDASDASLNQPGAPYNYGKVWLLPYNTFRDPNAGPYPVANVWYDNVIIASHRLPDPGVSVQPPTNLTGNGSGFPTTVLSWTRNTDSNGNYTEANFYVERCPGQMYDCEAGPLAAKTWSQIGTVPAGTTQYSDSTGTPGQVYSYRVRATDGTNNSTYSNPFTNVPRAPSDLTVSVMSGNRIHLTWTDNSDNESQFAIERCSGLFEYFAPNYTVAEAPDATSCLTAPLESGGTATLPFAEIGRVNGASGTGNVLSYDDTTATPGAVYSYRVRSLNAAGSLRDWYSKNSAYTANITVTNGASPCDLNGDGAVDVVDVQTAVNRMLSGTACATGDSLACTQSDVQNLIGVSLGQTSCAIP